MKQYYFASCSKGVETTLESELKSLGVKELTCGRGGVYFQYEQEAISEIVLQTRIASRLYWEIAGLPLHQEQDIYHEGMKISWNKFMNVNDTFKITTLFDSEAQRRFSNALYFSQLLKDSICDSFRDKTGQRPSVSKENPRYSFLLRVERYRNFFVGKVFLDLSGESLSNRGYRKDLSLAPIRENLAAAILMETAWAKGEKAFESPLVDPMCRSGTFLFEGILLKYRMPPSFLKIRHYLNGIETPWAFLNHKWFFEKKLKESFRKRCQDIQKDIESKLNSAIQPNGFLGSDMSGEAIKVAKLNARRSGLMPFIQFSQQDATKLEVDSENKELFIVVNPPYGERLEEQEVVSNLYINFTEHLKNNFVGSTLYLLTSNEEAKKKIRLKATRKIPLFNGPLECRLYEYRMF